MEMRHSLWRRTRSWSMTVLQITWWCLVAWSIVTALLPSSSANDFVSSPIPHQQHRRYVWHVHAASAPLLSSGCNTTIPLRISTPPDAVVQNGTTTDGGEWEYFNITTSQLASNSSSNNNETTHCWLFSTTPTPLNNTNNNNNSNNSSSEAGNVSASSVVPNMLLEGNSIETTTPTTIHHPNLAYYVLEVTDVTVLVERSVFPGGDGPPFIRFLDASSNQSFSDVRSGWLLPNGTVAQQDSFVLLLRPWLFEGTVTLRYRLAVRNNSLGAQLRGCPIAPAIAVEPNHLHPNESFNNTTTPLMGVEAINDQWQISTDFDGPQFWPIGDLTNCQWLLVCNRSARSPSYVVRVDMHVTLQGVPEHRLYWIPKSSFVFQFTVRGSVVLGGMRAVLTCVEVPTPTLTSSLSPLSESKILSPSWTTSFETRSHSETASPTNPTSSRSMTTPDLTHSMDVSHSTRSHSVSKPSDTPTASDSPSLSVVTSSPSTSLSVSPVPWCQIKARMIVPQEGSSSSTRIEWVLHSVPAPCRAAVPCNRTRLSFTAVTPSTAIVRLPPNYINGSSFTSDWLVGETLVFATAFPQRSVPVEITLESDDTALMIFVCSDNGAGPFPPSTMTPAPGSSPPTNGGAAAVPTTTVPANLGVILGVTLALAIGGVAFGLLAYYGWVWWKKRQDRSVQSGLELWVDDTAVVDDLRHDEMLVVRPTPMSEFHEADL